MKYRTIVVDPPWAYDHHWGAGIAPRRPLAYDCLSIAELNSLPIGKWAELDAHLYLWTTNSFIEEAHQVARAWGFTKKTILTWVKSQLGMGTYYRNNTEHVLFAVRGQLSTLRTDQPTAFSGQRGRHSEKPHAFYDMVQSMSPGPYLDVFARKLRFSWDAWGLEVGAPDGLPSPQEVAAATGEED